MFCQECGGRHRDTAKFCPHCGAKIESVIEESAATLSAEPTIIERKIEAIISDGTPTADAPQEAVKPLFYNESILEKEPLAGDGEDTLPDEPAASETTADDTAAADESPEPRAKSDNYILWRTLIGENDDYYIPEFEAIVRGEPSFNWTAFFFGGGLMLFRKMYAAFMAYYAPLLLFSFTGCFVLMFGLSSLDPFYMMVGSTLCGLIVLYWFLISLGVGHSFNKSYFKHLQKTIKRNNLLKTPPDKLQAVSFYGGTTVFPIIWVFVLSVLMLLFVQFLGINMGASLL